MNMRKKWWIVPLAIIGIPLFIFVGGEVVMHLWNWLLPPLFGWKTLGFWQALGLLLLCRILFGGLGHGGPGRHGGRGFRGRCRHMSPEERERFRKAMAEGYDVGAGVGERAAT
jgi:hypothetical protein